MIQFAVFSTTLATPTSQRWIHFFLCSSAIRPVTTCAATRLRAESVWPRDDKGTVHSKLHPFAARLNVDDGGFGAIGVSRMERKGACDDQRKKKQEKVQFDSKMAMLAACY